MSVSFAARMASFQLEWTGLSAAETIRVPICTPSAPSAKAAAMLRPSTMPPAAITGTRTFEQTSGSSTIECDLARILEPAALAALDHQPIDPGVDRLQRRRQRRHDMEHGQAGLFQRAAVAVWDRRPRW